VHFASAFAEKDKKRKNNEEESKKCFHFYSISIDKGIGYFIHKTA